MRMKFKKMSLGLAMIMAMVIGNLSMVKADTVPVSISLEKKVEVTDQAPEEKQEFTFVLEGENAETPMPADGSTVSIKGSGKAAFGQIQYTTPGDYHYQVYEKQEKVTGYTYDDTVFDLTVRVKYETVDGKEQLMPVIWAIRDGKEEKSELCFTNVYTKKQNTTPEPPGPKPPKGSSHVAKTGDETQISLWISLLAASFVVMSLIYKKVRQ